eukprot:TRINITY_DN576_c0_g1_i2.p2 TRINITY_DN576_c0_g1~~TRINITY_DN576_c0_g1_i2.p2  ORF type:complete len:130 (+),score=49.87 TRINITY_DN576_c0_g1_i2:611-1000(+)
MIETEMNKLKKLVLSKVGDKSEEVVAFVRHQQDLELRRRIEEKEKLEKIIEDNNARIAAQTEQMKEVVEKEARARKSELERKQQEEIEKKKIADAKRLAEIERRVAEEEALEKAKKPVRSKPVSFSLFG